MFVIGKNWGSRGTGAGGGRVPASWIWLAGPLCCFGGPPGEGGLGLRSIFGIDPEPPFAHNGRRRKFQGEKREAATHPRPIIFVHESVAPRALPKRPQKQGSTAGLIMAAPKGSPKGRSLDLPRRRRLAGVGLSRGRGLTKMIGLGSRPTLCTGIRPAVFTRFSISPAP